VYIASSLSTERLMTVISHFQDAENRLRITSLPELAIEIAVAKSVPIGTKTKTRKHVGGEIEERDSDDASRDSGPDRLAGNHETKESTVETLRPSTEENGDRRETAGHGPETAADMPRHASFSIVDLRDRWHEILREANRINASLTLALSNASPKEVKGDLVTLAVRFPFHRDRLADPGNALTLAAAFDTIFSSRTRIAVVVEDPNERENHPLISHALNTLGGEVV